MNFKPQPKPVFRKKKRQKKAKDAESVLQDQVNTLLKWMRIKYLRVPDLIGRLCSFKDKRLELWEKQELSDAFKGIPDNILFVGYGPYCLALNLELKTEVGTLGKWQKKYANSLPVTVTRGWREAEKAIKDFVKYADNQKTV